MNPTVPVVLFDQTSTANAAINTGNLDTSDFDELLVEIFPSAAVVAATAKLRLFDSDVGTTVGTHELWLSGNIPTTAGIKSAVVGPLAVAAATAPYLGGFSTPLPAKSQVLLDALGTAITGRLRVIGRRNFREIPLGTKYSG